MPLLLTSLTHLGQFSGNGLGYFGLSIFESVGYSTRMQFSLNVLNQFISATGAFLGMALSDRVPRRKALVRLGTPTMATTAAAAPQTEPDADVLPSSNHSARARRPTISKLRMRFQDAVSHSSLSGRSFCASNISQRAYHPYVHVH